MDENSTTWYAHSADDVAREVGVDPATGLSTAEAQQRLHQVGPNLLAASSRYSQPAASEQPVVVHGAVLAQHGEPQK